MAESRIPDSKYNPYEWREFFALTPKNVGGGKYVWLKRLERRISPYSPLGITSEYREIKK
jgi:hypothetical protein